MLAKQLKTNKLYLVKMIVKANKLVYKVIKNSLKMIVKANKHVYKVITKSLKIIHYS